MQNDFIAMIMEMRGGKVATDISQRLNELIDAIRDVGKSGKISVTLDIKPKRIDLHEGVKDVEIDYSIKITKPERHRGSSVFYVTPEGRLTRNDPAQSELFEEGVENNA